jgi:glutathione peroxidase
VRPDAAVRGLGSCTKYQARRVRVLGFLQPVRRQDPVAKAIRAFCETRFGVNFPMFAKIEVSGAGRHPLYAFLTGQATDSPGDQWNFAKFLVGKDGTVLALRPPGTGVAGDHRRGRQAL